MLPGAARPFSSQRAMAHWLGSLPRNDPRRSHAQAVSALAGFRASDGARLEAFEAGTRGLQQRMFDDALREGDAPGLSAHQYAWLLSRAYGVWARERLTSGRSEDDAAHALVRAIAWSRHAAALRHALRMPLRPEAWHHVHDMYRLAELANLTEVRVSRPGLVHTTVHAEYAAMLMWSLLSRPVAADEVPVVEDMLLATAREVEIDPAPVVGWHSHALDLQSNRGMVLWTETALSGAVRYVGMRSACAMLRTAGGLGERLGDDLEWAVLVAMQSREHRQESHASKRVACLVGAESMVRGRHTGEYAGWSLRRMDTHRAVVVGPARLNQGLLPGQWVGFRVDKPGAVLCLSRVVRIELLHGVPGRDDEVVLGVESLGQVMGPLRMEGAAPGEEYGLLVRDGNGELGLLTRDSGSRILNARRLVGGDHAYVARIGAARAEHAGWSLLRIDVLGREAIVSAADAGSGLERRNVVEVKPVAA